MLNIKDALYSGIHTVQENAKKINETVAPGIVHGIETAATKTGDALTAGKNTVVNTGAAAKDAVMDQLDANHDGKVDIEDIIILGLRTPGVKVERNRFLANEFRAHYDAATIEKAVKSMLDDAYRNGEKTGYVANLGHGITQWVDPDHAKVFVDTVHEYSTKYLG